MTLSTPTRHLRPEDLAGRQWRGLIRESSEEQADKWSPDRQRSDLERAADDLKLVPASGRRFYERTGSGEAEGVPELQQALADAKRGEYDVLLVLHTSRFARNRAEAVTMKRAFTKVGVAIYFVAQRIVSGSYSSALTEGISEVIDENENEQRRFWIAGGIRERQLSGRWVGHVPFGYRRKLVDFPDGSRGWDGQLEPDPDASAVVRRIFTETVQGRTAREIAVALNAEGAPQARGPWRRAYVATIIANPVYVGMIARYRIHSPSKHYYPEEDARDGRQQLAAGWPPLIEPKVAAEANSLLRSRTRRQRYGSKHRDYPLSGILVCGECGRPMTGMTNHRGTRYYRCTSYREGRGCSWRTARAEEVEGQFSDWAGSFQLPEDWAEHLARAAQSTDPGDAASTRDKLAAHLGRLRNLYAWGDLDEETYRTESAAVKAQIAALTRTNGGASVEAAAALLRDLGGAWRARPNRSLPQALLLRAVVRYRAVDEWVVRAELRDLLAACTPERLTFVARRATLGACPDRRTCP